LVKFVFVLFIALSIHLMMIQKLNAEFKEKGVSLVAVSKTRSDEQIIALYDTGQRIFGENRVQELVGKYDRLPKDIQWHLIGHLQTNKVKQIAPFVDLIHSVDSHKLLKEINKQAAANERVINVLLQFHIADEDAKYGLDKSTLEPILDAIENKELEHIKVCGLMGMATFTNDQEIVRSEFSSLKNIFDELSNKVLFDQQFSILSMGMSGDYQIAIEEGANMVRIGSLLFQ